MTAIDPDQFEDYGYCLLPGLLSADECRFLAAGYEDEARYRSRVVMAQHGFGRGEYRYFRYPLPEKVEDLRQRLYPPLARIANDWAGLMGQDDWYPDKLGDYLAACHREGQERPTPLILKYGAGDYNCLHQDLYGAMAFPLQVAVLLSRPGADFSGGEFVLTEQRPRMQSRAEVVPLRQGDAVVFPVNQRPKQGTRGTYRVKMRHGVSRVTEGQRFALGLIFHDAA